VGGSDVAAAWGEEGITHTNNSSNNSSSCTRRPALRTAAPQHEHNCDHRTLAFHQRKMQDSVRDDRGDALVLPEPGEKRLAGAVVLIFL